MSWGVRGHPLAGTGWRTGLVRLMFGAGFLCAVWMLLGAAEARADDGPSRAPSAHSMAAVRTSAVRLVDSKALSTTARTAGREHTGLSKAAVPRVRTTLAAHRRRAVVARIARPAMETGPATAASLGQVVSIVSHTRVGQIRPVTSVAGVLTGPALKDIAAAVGATADVTSPEVAAQVPRHGTAQAAVAALTPPRGLRRGLTAGPMATSSVAPHRVAPAPWGNDAPVGPGGPGGSGMTPVPSPDSAGNCSTTMDFALPAHSPVLPRAACLPVFKPSSRLTSTTAKEPGDRPD